MDSGYSEEKNNGKKYTLADATAPRKKPIEGTLLGGKVKVIGTANYTLEIPSITTELRVFLATQENQEVLVHVTEPIVIFSPDPISGVNFRQLTNELSKAIRPLISPDLKIILWGHIYETIPQFYKHAIAQILAEQDEYENWRRKNRRAIL